MDTKLLFVFLFFLSVTFALKKRSYKDFRVYDVIPDCDTSVEVLVNVTKAGVAEAWEENFIINSTAKLMVSSEKEQLLNNILGQYNIEKKIVIDDLQKVIDEQMYPNKRNTEQSHQFLSLSWDRYYNLENIHKWLHELAELYPDVVTVVHMGQSYQLRDIMGIIIDYKPGLNNVSGLIEGTIHAREWISSATVTWIIKEFLTSSDPNVRDLAENIQWHIFPVVNPDGYVYTFTHDRMWRKNRNPINAVPCSEDIDDDMGNGIDLNRNFGYLWMSEGASDDPCSNTYAGPLPNSEPETQAIINYVLNLKQQTEIIYYIAFHSYTQLVIMPYSHLQGADVLEAENYGDMFEIATRGAAKIQQRYNTEYRVGVSADVMYKMSGTSVDWAKGEADIPIVYLFELRDLGTYGFLLPTEQIIPNCLEIMDGFLEMDKTTRSLRYYSISGSQSICYSQIVLIVGIIPALFMNKL